MSTKHFSHFYLTKPLFSLPFIFPAWNIINVMASPNIGKNESLSDKPNIVFILMDDVGWKDLGCYGSKFYKTPNIDSLAKQGIRFTNSYAYPQSSPSRYGLLTGQNPARAGLTRAIVPTDHTAGGPHERIFSPRSDWYLVEPSILDHMPEEIQTLPELLHNAGYATAMFGKWHLGTMKDDPPTRHGFDIYFGGAESGPHSYFSPYKLEYLKDGPAGEQVDDRLTDEAINFIMHQQSNKREKQPFFLYMAYYDVHEPWQAKSELIEQFRKKIDFGDRQINPIYAAMIATLDNNIGKLSKFLEEKGLMENTLFIISSDNGGVDVVNGFGRDNRGTFPIGTTITSNEPLRGGKSMIYEGGIRVPTIVLWPGARQGVDENTPIAIWDWMPTLLETIGIAKPKDQEIDGTNLLPLILRSEKAEKRSLFWHFPHYQIGASRYPEQTNFVTRPCTAIRQGDWKLIYYYDAPPELYNLANDFRENKNVANQNPQIVHKLSKEILRWLKEIHAYIPLRNINYSSQSFH